MRLLHGGHGAGGGVAAGGAAQPQRGRRPRGPRGEPVSLHRVPQHRQGGPRRLRAGGGGVMTPVGTTVPGPRLLRREDAEILTGEAKYVDDLAIPGALWLALVRSPVARARIRSIDTSAAKESPGVVAVYTGEDLMGEWAAPLPVALTATPDQKVPAHYPLTSGTVNYVGDAVAVVVATSRQEAIDALANVVVDYDP